MSQDESRDVGEAGRTTDTPGSEPRNATTDEPADPNGFDLSPPRGGIDRPRSGPSRTDLATVDTVFDDLNLAAVKEHLSWALFLDEIDPTVTPRLQAAIGIAALSLAILLVAVPWLPVWFVGPFLPLVVLAQAGSAGVILLGLIAGGIGGWGLYRLTGTTPTDPSDEAGSIPPDRTTSEHQPANPGAQLNERIARISGEAGDPPSGMTTRIDRRKVRTRLRRFATDVLREAHSISTAEARTALDEGTWTDSRRAAAFLGGNAAPRPRLATRIRDWASGDPYERRVRATVDEIARLASVSVGPSLLTAPRDRIDTNRHMDKYHSHDTISIEETSLPSVSLDTLGESGSGLPSLGTAAGIDEPLPGEATDGPEVEARGTEGDGHTGDTDGDGFDDHADQPPDSSTHDGPVPNDWVRPGNGSPVDEAANGGGPR